MSEFIDEAPGLESTTIGIYRTSATVKGGRRFSFGALVVVGDRNGNVGLGYGKAPGVPAAIEKAQKYARKAMHKVLLQGGTIPHTVVASFSASEVRLVPASPGTGVIAGGTLRAVLEMAGVRDCLTKAYGSTNQKNLAKAVMLGLRKLRTKAAVAELRGVELEPSIVDAKLEQGARFAPAPSAAPAVRKPQAARPQRGGKPQRGGRSGGGRGRGEAPAAAPAPQAAEPTQSPENPEKKD